MHGVPNVCNESQVMSSSRRFDERLQKHHRQMGRRQPFVQGECRTSRQHHGCFGDLHQCWISCKLDVKVDETDRERPIRVDLRVRGPPSEDVPHGTHVPKNAKGLRGLQYCPTCDRFLNRDRNSALCIAKLFVITRIDGRPVPPQFQPRYKSSKVANGNSPPREATG